MRRIILLALIFSLVAAAGAQYKKPFFQTLSVESGLPEATIMSSLQDKLGYMWFGTLNGLVRYDGYQVKLYCVLNDDGLPVSSSIASYLYEDRAGKLWAFFFQEGLYYLDRSKDAFLKVNLDKQSLDKLKGADLFRKWMEDKQQPHSHWLFTHYAIEDLHHVYLFDDVHNTMEDYSATGKGNYYIPMIHGGADIAQDANGKIWIIADSLLSYFNWDTKSFQPVFVLPDSSKKYMFSVITPDPADGNVLWLNTWIPNYTGTSSPSKFIRFNTKTKTYKIFTPADIDPGLPATSYKNFFTDSLKRVWISTNNAIALYNNSSGTFTNFHLQAAASNSDIHVRSIASDAAGNLWIGAELRGVFYLDVKNAGITHYPSVGNPGGLSSNDKLFFDRAGTLWINEPSVGISWLDRERSLLNPTPIASFHSPEDRQADPDQYQAVGTADDSCFFVTDSSGLFLWNHRQNSFTKMNLKVKSSFIDIASVVQEKDGTIWIGTYNDGLIRFDPSTNTQKNYRYNAKDTLSISSDNISSLVIDKTGTLWIGTFSKGVCKLDKGNGVFTRLPFIQNNNTIEAAGVLDDNNVQVSYLDRAGILWIGTVSGGLNRIEPATGKITSFLNYKKGFFAVTAIQEDHLERLWAGTYMSGLFVVDKKTGSLVKYTVKDGLINNSVLAIKEDNKGNIWVTTIGGLSMFDPEKKQFKNYPMQIPALNRLFVKESNGSFDIITKKGLLSFDPAQLNKSPVPPTVIIESVSYHTANNKDTVLFTEGRNDAELKYNENRISFNYVALHYEHADRNQYAYKLDGYDKDWIPAGIQRTITYTNLSPDTYTFHVKAANSDGVWNETGASFVITILPPFWETWWFRVLSVIALIIVIYAIIRERSRKLKAENILLEEKVTERTVQLKKSLEDLKSTQAQLIHSEKMASLGELTAGIAHEIQNPLNFVNNFSEVNKEMIDEATEGIDKGNIDEVKNILTDIKENEDKINHHGKRADAIVKGMLQHSKQTKGVKEPTDINALCDEYLRLSYHGLRAKDKSFNADFKTDFDASIDKINIVPQDIGRVLLNLFNNAFYAVNEKFTANRSPLTDDYKPLVSVQTKKIMPSLISSNNDHPLGDGGIEICVSDNGPGIPKNIVDKIFQPFFTTKPTGQGTGLGLSLAYDIIKAHGGEIKVKTKEGEGLPGEQTGTEFIIWLAVV